MYDSMHDKGKVKKPGKELPQQNKKAVLVEKNRKQSTPTSATETGYNKSKL